MAVKPKLCMIPSGVGTDTLYSVLPADGTGDFTFDRNLNTATRINKDGLIEMVDADVPRLNYPLIDGVVSGCPSLLLEPSRSNSFSYSEPIANEGAALDISYEPFIWTLGFTNCVKLGDNSAVRFRYGGSVSASTQYTISAFVIMDDLSEPLVGNSSSVGDFSFVVGGGTGGVVNSNVHYGNNIYRVSVTLTSGSNLSNNGVIKYTTQSSKGFRITGFQLEQGSYATSYIPTQGSIATRSAETCNNAGDVNTFNDSEGVLMAEISALVNSDTINPNRGIGISSGSTNNTIFIYYQSALNVLSCILISNGTTQFSYSTTLFDVDDYLKIALKYKQNDFALWVNGFEIATDTSGNTPIGLNELAFDNGAGNDDFYGSTKQIQYYNTALTDAELEKLTSYDSFRDMAIAGQYKTY